MSTYPYEYLLLQILEKEGDMIYGERFRADGAAD